MKKIVLTISMILGVMLSSQQALAQGSVKHSAQALNLSAQASGHTVIAGAKLSSAVVAVPLLAVGAVGAVSSEAGKAFLKESSSDFNKPLTISDESVTAGPSPDAAVNQTEL